MHPPFSINPTLQHQRGVALYVVIVFVMLSMLLALWASRTALFNEMVVSNDADYQRTFEAAQAMLQDAEVDIQCSSIQDGPKKPQYCRRTQTNPSNPRLIPQSNDGGAIDELEDSCQNGVCGRINDWSIDFAKTIRDNASRYGEFTSASHKGASSKLLEWDKDNPSKAKAWYWIEVLKYKKVAAMDSQFKEIALNSEDKPVYRITAQAIGNKPGTEIILQQLYISETPKD